jgi:hypothetical protein
MGIHLKPARWALSLETRGSPLHKDIFMSIYNRERIGAFVVVMGYVPS